MIHWALSNMSTAIMCDEMKPATLATAHFKFKLFLQMERGHSLWVGCSFPSCHGNCKCLCTIIHFFCLEASIWSNPQPQRHQRVLCWPPELPRLHCIHLWNSILGLSLHCWLHVLPVQCSLLCVCLLGRCQPRPLGLLVDALTGPMLTHKILWL